MSSKFDISEQLKKFDALDEDLLMKAENCFKLLVDLSQTWKNENIFKKVEIIKMLCFKLSVDNEKALHLAERELFMAVRKLSDSIWLG